MKPAFLQADAAAEQVAAAGLDEEPAMHFEPMSMGVMEQESGLKLMSGVLAR